MKKRSRFIRLCLALCMALLGMAVLLNNLGKPRIEAAGLHVPDVMGLVASGMLFGVAIVALFGSLGTWDE